MKDCGQQQPAEVLVVGAGPAGLACAIASAKQGLEVDLVDAMKPPIDKACGEGLMPGSLHSLAALGLSVERDFHPGQTHLLRGIRFLAAAGSSGAETTVEAAFPGAPGRGIRRTHLHEVLLERATALGVRFHWESSVQGIVPGTGGTAVYTNRQSFRARYLVGADGHQSRVAKWAQLTEASIHSRRIGLRQHYAVSPWTDFVEVYWSDYGQAYVTPVSSQEVCVAFLGRKKFSSPAEALTLYPALEQRLSSACPTDRARGSITLTRRLRRVVSGNVALAGDASGSVDAVTGEGLGLCFRQATALSLAIKAEDLGAYQRAHRCMHRLPGVMSRALLLLENGRLRARVLSAFKRHPALFDRLLETHIGHSPVRILGDDGLLAAGLHTLTG